MGSNGDLTLSSHASLGRLLHLPGRQFSVCKPERSSTRLTGLSRRFSYSRSWCRESFHQKELFSSSSSDFSLLIRESVIAKMSLELGLAVSGAVFEVILMLREQEAKMHDVSLETGKEFDFRELQLFSRKREG